MHAIAIINALALSAALAHTAAIPGSEGATARLQRRNGCYSTGELKSKYLGFEDLHGTKHTDNAEVATDITTTCLMVQDKVFKAGEVWTRCSEWAETIMSDCEGNCLKSCGGDTPTFPSSTALADMSASGICMATCPSQCSGKEDHIVSTGTNRIDWAIKNTGSSDATLSFDDCNRALNTELGGCEAGSEQQHSGFWYRIDPNQGKCSA
jgi:hypothetical protein